MQIIHSDVDSPSHIDLSSIQLTLAEKQSELPHICRSGIPVILSVPEKQSNRYVCIMENLCLNICSAPAKISTKDKTFCYRLRNRHTSNSVNGVDNIY